LNYTNHIKLEFFLTNTIQSTTSGILFKKKKVQLPQTCQQPSESKMATHTDTSKTSLVPSPAPAGELPGKTPQAVHAGLHWGDAPCSTSSLSAPASSCLLQEAALFVIQPAATIQ